MAAAEPTDAAAPTDTSQPAPTVTPTADASGGAAAAPAAGGASPEQGKPSTGEGGDAAAAPDNKRQEQMKLLEQAFEYGIFKQQYVSARTAVYIVRKKRVEDGSLDKKQCWIGPLSSQVQNDKDRNYTDADWDKIQKYLLEDKKYIDDEFARRNPKPEEKPKPLEPEPMPKVDGSQLLKDELQVTQQRAQQLVYLQREVHALEEKRDATAEKIKLLEHPVLDDSRWSRAGGVVFEEARALSDLKRRTGLAQEQLKKVKQDAADAREHHKAEQQKLIDRIAAIEKDIRMNQDDRSDQETQLQRLRDEKAEMLEEILAEQDRCERLELEKRDADRRVLDANRKLHQLKKRAQERSVELQEVMTSAKDIELQEQTLLHQCAELSANVQRMRQQVAEATQKLELQGDHGSLRREYEDKLRIWSSLEGPARMQEDTEFLRRETLNLKHNLSRAREESEALHAAATMLQRETKRAEVAIVGLRQDNIGLERTTEALHDEARAFLEEEELAVAKDAEGVFPLEGSTYWEYDGEEEELPEDEEDEEEEYQRGFGHAGDTHLLDFGHEDSRGTVPNSSVTPSVRYLDALAEYTTSMQPL